MYHILISGNNSSWTGDVEEFSISRTLREYTDDDITQRYSKFDSNVLDELYGMPAMFVYEQEGQPTKFGHITSVGVEDDRVKIRYKIDPTIPELASGLLSENQSKFGIRDLELFRTHWAIKKVDLYQTLKELGQEIPDLPEVAPVQPSGNRPKVFIVHGQDGVAKNEVADQLRKLGCEPIILHEQANRGQTIIEKIEANTDVKFGVVLYTPCDVGAIKQDELHLKGRARQNVVFEHGYLIARLGRDKVAALQKGNLETPSDISGLVYIPMIGGDWKTALEIELKEAKVI